MLKPNLKSKDELAVIARKVVSELKKENLVLWQAKEVLLFAKEEIEDSILA